MGQAIWVTAVALALINIGLATLIVNLVGAAVIAPLWLGVVILAGGAVAAVGAVFLWREYLTEARRG